MSKRIEIWAVDFDGTLCESTWPGIGRPNIKLIDLLIKSRKEGIKLILWTCREGEKLQEAVKWCRDHGLEFDAVNDNLPEMISLHGNNCRKVFAAKYIDDLSADKEQYGIPFHGEPEPDKELIEKYPIGSKWLLRAVNVQCEVEIVKNDGYGEITAKSISKKTNWKHYEVRHTANWFEDKLVPLREEKQYG